MRPALRTRSVNGGQQSLGGVRNEPSPQANRIKECINELQGLGGRGQRGGCALVGWLLFSNL